MNFIRLLGRYLGAARPFSVLVLGTVYVVVACHVLQVFPNGLLQVLEGYAYNQRVRLLPAKPVVDPIVIVDIDEASLAQLGRWPWTRFRLAALIDQLFDQYQVHTLGLDLLLSESESGPADEALAAAIEGRRVVVGYHFNGPSNALASQAVMPDQMLTARSSVIGAMPKTVPGVLPESDFSPEALKNRYSVSMVAKSSSGILKQFLEAAADAGHINPQLDDDGVTRRVPALIAFEHGLYTSLSIAVIRTAIGGAGMQADQINQRVPGAAIEWLELVNPKQSVWIPVDRELMMQIPFKGGPGSFTYVSAVDVLNGRADPALLKDKIVLLGTSASGLFDLRNTPVSSVFPGVEIHANAVSAILNQQLLQKPAWNDAWQLVVLAVVMFLALIVMGYATPVLALAGMVMILTALVGLNLYWWKEKLWVVPLAPTLFGIIAGVGAALLERWVSALRQSKRVEGTFARYVPKEVARRLAKDPERDLMKAREHHLAIMFTDIAGFTGLARKLPPEQIAQLLREVLTPLSATIHEHQGTIDKYIGDAVMAFWGAPLEVQEPEQRALDAAMMMVTRLSLLQDSLKARSLPRIAIGIGIHSGIAYVGDMGSSFRSTYTAIGDHVNLAARVEGLTRFYGVSILVTETVMKSCEANYLFRFVDRLIVKGYDSAVSIYEPLALLASLSDAQNDLYRSWMKEWEDAHALYRNADWEEARLAMLRLIAHPHLGAGAKAFLRRIDRLEKDPPLRRWDGVWTMDEK
ncbi:MAG: adenylate/guanylate cyclase domain-containing protein [Betaproteobacteria bacterium]|nr:adenylate/guanylate cyclase domain-containing protein [Pseudomonadota bacterium]NBO03476.1 adenylate/guanylate cyclase domain-containing protein [Betaproteobacteria bacterium]NBO94355.1 adenylate/guanylate cyclase domain-containing protein [Betaproteobacteria bacterium]NBP34667.1 adenylate/guanylate cyclase domain-containing protein [Betaproteobacteria bacterium]NBP39203.1 adenylate/guanylate cyclase domain-containing protein [Betaproteobacteria bacterium]